MFDKACRKVALYIDRDWPALYRALPFYPERGVKTIDEDVRDMSRREQRGGLADVALRAISRWRRHHTRANIDDLGAALAAIRRTDVLRQMDSEVNPPVPEVAVLSDVPDWVDVELIPYWREVERYDQLRAAHKVSSDATMALQ